MRQRDELAIHNERVKLYVTISNAVGLAFFGLGVAALGGWNGPDHALGDRTSRRGCRNGRKCLYWSWTY
ncbi:hypothetical protein [uncultured Jannaschia sp.]|uniref:hypothetical protein n=1 Tax=uncultured Jannaschia sp. TaxID=293347 RepID=UPI002631ED74|nr:hypothetical protein [uncultured Jannaschia sp.]